MELEKVKAVIADVLNVESTSVTEDSSFIDDLGADSLDITQIIMGIEEAFDVDFDVDEVDIDKIKTVEDLVELIKQQVQE